MDRSSQEKTEACRSPTLQGSQSWQHNSRIGNIKDLYKVIIGFSSLVANVRIAQPIWLRIVKTLSWMCLENVASPFIVTLRSLMLSSSVILSPSYEAYAVFSFNVLSDPYRIRANLQLLKKCYFYQPSGTTGLDSPGVIRHRSLFQLFQTPVYHRRRMRLEPSEP